MFLACCFQNTLKHIFALQDILEIQRCVAPTQEQQLEPSFSTELAKDQVCVRIHNVWHLKRCMAVVNLPAAADRPYPIVPTRPQAISVEKLRFPTACVCRGRSLRLEATTHCPPISHADADGCMKGGQREQCCSKEQDLFSAKDLRAWHVRSS